MSVDGVTIRCLHRSLGRVRTSADNTARSGHDRRGRPTCRRSTATSWRSTNSSATSADSPRATCGNQPNTRTALRYSSRTSMHSIFGASRKKPAHALCDSFGTVRPAHLRHRSLRSVPAPSSPYRSRASDDAPSGHPAQAAACTSPATPAAQPGRLAKPVRRHLEPPPPEPVACPTDTTHRAENQLVAEARGARISRVACM